MTRAPIILSALFGPEEFAWLNGLRRAHFPVERNQLDAHLTLFHHLPPSLAPELKQRLGQLTQRPAPPALADRLINLGRGTAVGIQSNELLLLREDLARDFSGLLSPQDAANWRPHVTIQNKVSPAQAHALQDQLAHDFRPRPIRIVGLAAWWYRSGPWELMARYPFR